METDKRVELAIRPPTQEVITQEELRKLFEEKEKPGHYIGLEISGLLHLGSLVLTGFKLRDLTAAGVNTTVYLADWHSAINRKLGGDWDRIRQAAEYYEDAFRFFVPGVRIVLGSDLYRGNDNYWKNVLEFSKHVSVARATRTLTIMGRSSKEKLDLAQYFYPPMQGVDIHELQADIAHAGMDQRKVHMLAREVYPKLGWKPPVALHHELLLGLRKPEGAGLDEEEEQDIIVSSKMSKSHPEASIFIHDSREEIESKMQRAFCPPGEVKMNPVLQYVRLLVFHEKKEFKVERPAKFGGDIIFTSYQEVEKTYSEGKLHPADLKFAVAKEIDEMVRDIRKHFERKVDAIKALLI
ncbi:MAG: tyrosine--tRNA ligase [Conexivisphaerales archaeon]